jgi:hypothetical protein
MSQNGFWLPERVIVKLRRPTAKPHPSRITLSKGLLRSLNRRHAASRQKLGVCVSLHSHMGATLARAHDVSTTPRIAFQKLLGCSRSSFGDIVVFELFRETRS